MGTHQHLYDGDGWDCEACGECRCTAQEPHPELPPIDSRSHWSNVTSIRTLSMVEDVVAALVEHDLVEEQPIGDLLRALRGER